MPGALRSGQLPLGADNVVLPFRVEPLDTRGRAVRLGDILDAILDRHNYPAPVARLLAEAIALTTLIGSSLKFEGRFQLQTKTDGAVSMLVVDFSSPSDVRAYASFDADRIGSLRDDAGLLGQGHMGFTIEQTALQSRYQGIVALDGQGLQAAALQYFKQSEQIPSAIRLAVAEEQIAGPEGVRHRWRAGGILAQFLPSAPERMRVADLDPGDAPEGIERHQVAEDDAWIEARLLVETTEDIELVDSTLGLDRLLYRLFNERGVTVSDPVPLHDQCRCSEGRVREMLGQFSADDLADMREHDGMIGITCEFCSRRYRLSL
ncbi:COG1281 Disulfide bond chaperones of the HSP33 family [Rhabdaerophilaceae bacterium]